MTGLLRCLLRGDDLYFTSDSDAFDDWSLETALTAWEHGGRENDRQENGSLGYGEQREMTAKEMTAREGMKEPGKHR